MFCNPAEGVPVVLPEGNAMLRTSSSSLTSEERDLLALKSWWVGGVVKMSKRKKPRKLLFA